ncbi:MULTISPECIES: SDR family NAD(P)-dependent oxidoreductase [Halopseudomonas]|uniref:Dehydrogenase n=1 Tax=Halopseudomonas pelagia TaxID=553151 RepID=A0AA91U2W5_9GAMM|nr:SDR family NAD(P)-dependent oxidoreductase [Halopseudomonas pelagia]MBQ0741841.1 SDR family oxidoreductase [Pseudomonas sp.]WOD10037.1 SDR family NAD(P)-dependent oxidoreductase [Pseudomonas sp. NyZ704]MBQ0776205.1 SDR family oxidoreductase [Pseudomonas sp.]PCC99537.1 dehydrogenase [Halopseudomonas pelagia]QFY56524.1 SDR family oxidoreductase [Halopseudomonas pelagia]|tara:strand:+ start:2233 stop:2991 length:759 start_codon:yes stop_codon:yes gene_type:complete
MGRLEGKVALITGTGGGQGRVAALRFAREGATVVGCDTNEDENKITADLMAQEGYILHGYAPVDLGDHEQAKAWVESAVAEHGRIDVLYNNASAARFAPVQDMTIEDWHFTIRNEVDLIFYTTKYAWNHLAERKGVILNVSSTAAWGGSKVAGISAHSAAKGAVVSFTRQLAVEGASAGIRAISISPGFVATPGTAAFMENPVARAALLDGVLMDRPGQPEEVVSLAVYLASDEASFITGSDIVIDGGLLAI